MQGNLPRIKRRESLVKNSKLFKSVYSPESSQKAEVKSESAVGPSSHSGHSVHNTKDFTSATDILKEYSNRHKVLS